MKNQGETAGHDMLVWRKITLPVLQKLTSEVLLVAEPVLIGVVTIFNRNETARFGGFVVAIVVPALERKLACP